VDTKAFKDAASHRQRGDPVNRREVIVGLGSAVAWPLVANAQQGQRMRRIGVFMVAPPEDARTQAFTAALLQGLQELGWTVGRNVQLEWRWYTANDTRTRKDAEELVSGRCCKRAAPYPSCS
jgi:putative tryptophan/tyrosine transport system substrate-binding protein